MQKRKYERAFRQAGARCERSFLRVGIVSVSEDKNTSRRKTVLRVINISLTAILVLLLCFVILKIFFITWATVDQSSMYPTYGDGDTVFVSRLGQPERGSIVVYYDKDVSVPRLASAFGLFSGGAKLLIKRVVATENDMIWLEPEDNGYTVKILYADADSAAGEEYTDGEGKPVELAPLTLDPDTVGILRGKTRWDPYIVGEGCVFAMGDNRAVSQDSRVFGDVPVSRIIGTVIG